MKEGWVDDAQTLGFLQSKAARSSSQVNGGWSWSILIHCVWLFVTRDLQLIRLLRPSLSPRVCSNSYPLYQCCYLTISSSVTPFSFYPLFFPASGFFSNELALHIRWPSIRVSISASVLPMNIHSWFPLGLTGLISLLSKGLSRVFSSWPFYSWPLNNKGLGHLLPTQLKIHT